MQIEIVRHDGGAEYPHRDVKHRGIPEDLGLRNETAHHCPERRLRENDLEQKTKADGRDEGNDERLQQPESLVLQIEHEQDVERRNDDAVRDRNAEEQVERNRSSYHL